MAGLPSPIRVQLRSDGDKEDCQPLPSAPQQHPEVPPSKPRKARSTRHTAGEPQGFPLWFPNSERNQAIAEWLAFNFWPTVSSTLGLWGGSCRSSPCNTLALGHRRRLSFRLAARASAASIAQHERSSHAHQRRGRTCSHCHQLEHSNCLLSRSGDAPQATLEAPAATADSVTPTGSGSETGRGGGNGGQSCQGGRRWPLRRRGAARARTAGPGRCGQAGGALGTAKSGNLRKAQGPVIERPGDFCNRLQMWSETRMQADPTACGMRGPVVRRRWQHGIRQRAAIRYPSRDVWDVCQEQSSSYGAIIPILLKRPGLLLCRSRVGRTHPAIRWQLWVGRELAVSLTR